MTFQVLTRFEPLEFEGLQPVYWRKTYRSEPYASEGAAFNAAREQFAWVEPGWRENLQSDPQLAPAHFPG